MPLLAQTHKKKTLLVYLVIKEKRSSEAGKKVSFSCMAHSKEKGRIKAFSVKLQLPFTHFKVAELIKRFCPCLTETK